ncbi:unnamed protein product [Sphenostylis stenocarpa]|uniref:Ubiquitin carboxyl-terminal hydrolase 7 ICP0-binding domain-containing protein n=1 Tax=Sphenostylis stenocarpa TaxID=92480 RepID=A0AA86SM71_9FABA|nr:unnamed protein product [Sphenostylis stenocarpa]
MSSTSTLEEVAKEFNVPVQFQRYWLWAKRQNHTYRPNRPLTSIEEAQSVNSHFLLGDFVFYFVGQLREVSNKVHNAELKLFLEVEMGMCTGKPLEILTRLNEMAGYDPEEDIALYEVGLY